MIDIWVIDSLANDWKLVERVKCIDYIRDDLKERVAMIDAAGGDLPGVGMYTELEAPGIDKAYWLDPEHPGAVAWMHRLKN